ncbi:MAG: hypothetical protein IPJ15_05960 [Actinomycetales bacterium]|nr:hypothetical protein [Candidatus Phosphoribacter baldrii]
MHEELDGSSADWTPAFPGQRPPFEPGNTVALQHGAFSPRFVDPLAADLVGMVLEDPQVGYLTAPAYRPALWAWARAEAQAQLLVEYLARAGQESGDGVGDLDLDRVRTAYLLLHRAESRADRSRARLGLDPLSRARLGKDVAQAKAADAAAIMAELHRLEQQGQMHATGMPGLPQEPEHAPPGTDARPAHTGTSGAGQ